MITCAATEATASLTNIKQCQAGPTWCISRVLRQQHLLLCCLAALSVLTPLRAVLSVANTSALPPNLPQPELQGQTQAEAHLTGTISIADVSLLAVPGNYNVSAILPDHMEVTFL